jgi:hypothetical protein
VTPSPELRAGQQQRNRLLNPGEGGHLGDAAQMTTKQVPGPRLNDTSRFRAEQGPWSRRRDARATTKASTAFVAARVSGAVGCDSGKLDCVVAPCRDEEAICRRSKRVCVMVSEDRFAAFEISLAPGSLRCRDRSCPPSTGTSIRSEGYGLTGAAGAWPSASCLGGAGGRGRGLRRGVTPVGLGT